ncbi:MAG: toll/interleukin-1 receptor domain-containing protein [bacterium]
MAFDVFISHSSKDKNFADEICLKLEQNSINCWIAPRNILAGSKFGLSIIEAINECKIILLVLTENSNESEFVSKEIDRALDKGKIIIPVRFSDIKPKGELECFVSNIHWFNAFSSPSPSPTLSGSYIHDLVKTVNHYLSIGGVDTKNSQPSDSTKDNEDIEMFYKLASNIKIQGIVQNNLNLSINGASQRISNSLIELKSLMEINHTDYFNYKEKIYIISSFTNESFDFLLGKIDFNQTLTKKLVENLSTINKTVNDCAAKLAKITDWQTKPKIYSQVRNEISSWFIGVVGSQLTQLWSIGNDKDPELYIQKSAGIVKKTLDLVFFTFLSKLWDKIKSKGDSLILKDEERDLLELRLKAYDELEILERYKQLKNVVEIFINNDQLNFPFPELKDFYENNDGWDELFNYCKAIYNLEEKSKNNELELMDCYEAENNLAMFLIFFKFLVNYKMVSMKTIEYRKMRDNNSKYLHKYILLGSEKNDKESINITDEDVFNDSVLIYQGENYREGINLFPFIIDYNVINFEEGSKICFFLFRALDNNCFTFGYNDNNGAEEIKKPSELIGIADRDEFFKSKEKRKLLNRDYVIELFYEADKCILNC